MTIQDSLQRLCVLAALKVLLIPAIVDAHDHGHPTAEEIQQARDDGSYDARLARTLRSQPHRLSNGLAQRAAYKLRRASLEASGLSAPDVANRLHAGPQPAFPFTSPRELRPFGTVETLTVLIDFKDRRAATELPVMDAQRFTANIYGGGTAEAQNHVPYESLNAYYRRASQGIVDVQGNVLGWHHFANNRSSYEPANAPPGPNQETVQAFLDNQAIFDMAVEVLEAQDATHDFARYDNDNDGDIDLITILYAGPNTGWGNFWWAYRWSFFVQDAANKRFDGKRLRQFVFQFVDTRGPNDDDFDPVTLLHEMGHAFGLADYYDYDAAVGPQGGVGGLDMMHGNWGNHNAFSRWLLDWIDPTVIGSAPPALSTLNASGSTIGTDKAIAIFPGLPDTSAPGQEMFLIENRSRFGNDAGVADTPSDGLLIWHVDATVNAAGNDFEFDNSFTSHKLIRLVRANTPNDFLHNETASAATYFNAGEEFTPTSSVSSEGLNGPTGVSVDQVSANGEIMNVRIGILPSTPDRADTGPPRLVSRDSSFRDTAAELIADAASPPSEYVDLDKLEELDRVFTTASADELAGLWNRIAPRDAPTDRVCQSTLALQVLLTHWAAKNGPAAARSIQRLPHCSFRSRTWPLALQTWANSDATTAADWYFDDQQSEVRESDDLIAGSEFADTVFECCARTDAEHALKLLEKLEHSQELWGAIHALRHAGEMSGRTPQELHQDLGKLRKHSHLAESIREVQESLEHAGKNITDADDQAEFRKLLREYLDRDSTR